MADVDILLRNAVKKFEEGSGLKVDRLVDFHTPFPDEEDLALEVAVVGKKNPAFIRFREDGTFLGWGWIRASGGFARE